MSITKRGHGAGFAALILVFLLLVLTDLAAAGQDDSYRLDPFILEANAEGRLAHIFQRGRLIVGVKTDYAPWGMRDRSGKIIGMEADLALDLGARLGLPVELKEVTTPNRIGMLTRGNVDLLIATMADTSGRRELIDFIRPHYYASGVRLLVPEGKELSSWDSVAQLPICLTEGAFFNRALIEQYDIRPLFFSGTRDSRLALGDGRCIGWAYDDSALSQVVASGQMPGYQLGMSPVMTMEWGIGVPLGEADQPLGQFISQAVADWHRSGFLLSRQTAWGIPETPFLQEQAVLFSARDEQGELRCQWHMEGGFPESCLRLAPMPSASSAQGDGIGFTVFLDELNRQRLLTGIGTTVGVTVVAIIGSLLMGVLFALADQSSGSILKRLLLTYPTRAIISFARMSPPILQLYVIFFGLGGLLMTRFGITLSGFLVACVVFSVYAGSSNAAVLSPALTRITRNDPDLPLLLQIGRAIEQSFEAIVSILVNIAKAAGMATVIAVPEIISIVNRLIGEGENATVLMTMLLVFYFAFVLLIMTLLNQLRRVIQT